MLEFGEKVSFLLLLPPSEEVCTAPGQKNPYSPRSGFLTLPLQIFELGSFFFAVFKAASHVSVFSGVIINVYFGAFLSHSAL